MATRTIAPSGATYTSWTAANSASFAGDVHEFSGDWSGGYDSSGLTISLNNITVQTNESGPGGAGSTHNGTYNGSGTNYILQVASTSGGHALGISGTGVVIKDIIIEQSRAAAGGNSEECVRVLSGGSATFENCIFKQANQYANGDCVYGGGYTATINLKNCIAHGAGRAGFHAQNHTGTSTLTMNVNGCTVINCGRTTSNSGGIGGEQVSGSTCNVNVYQTISVNNTTASGAEDFCQTLDGGSTNTCTITTQDCISSDASQTANATATRGYESITVVAGAPASGELGLTNITLNSENLNLEGTAANNKGIDDSTISATSEPTGLGQLTTDIVGNTRPDSGTSLQDFGAFEFIPAGGASLSIPVAMNSYRHRHQSVV